MPTPINQYLVKVLPPGVKDGVVALQLKRRRLLARAWPGCKAGQAVHVRIRPEEVLVATGVVGSLSASNVLAARVRALEAVAEGVYIVLDAGFPLRTLVTEGTVKRLALKVGAEVAAVFKVMAVEPVPSAAARLAVVLKGKRGPLRGEHMELLRQVHATGSLSAAAKGLGVSFRTAWLWSQAVNKDFGRPLLAPAHGGKGGGGCVLSSEARAWLRAAEALELSASKKF